VEKYGQSKKSPSVVGIILSFWLILDKIDGFAVDKFTKTCYYKNIFENPPLGVKTGYIAELKSRRAKQRMPYVAKAKDGQRRIWR